MDTNMSPETQAKLTTLRRQYFQLVEPTQLRWPNDEVLKTSEVQSWMFNSLFDVDSISYPPPERYQLRVLKLLISKLERSIDDPEKDEISDGLMSAFSALLCSSIPTESVSIQQKAYVTYAYPVHLADGGVSDDYTVTVFESRSVLSSFGTTGGRTWEASLPLATFLTTEEGRRLIQGKRVFELGAGTGMLTILCAKYLGVSGMVATDGDEGIVDALKTNIFLNGLDSGASSHSTIRTAALKWGRRIDASSFAEDYGMEVPDVLLGADVIYDKRAVPSLCASLRQFFEVNSALLVLIAATIRNEQTFETFQNACKRNGFSLELVELPQVPEHVQDGPFYPTSNSMPIQIWRITGPQGSRDPFSI